MLPLLDEMIVKDMYTGVVLAHIKSRDKLVALYQSARQIPLRKDDGTYAGLSHYFIVKFR